MNLLLQDYFQREAWEPNHQRWSITKRIEETAPGLKMFKNLNADTREFFVESRLNDLKNIQKVSLYSLLPLTILSFAGGYVISGQMLKPISDLNEEVKKKSLKNFKEKIEYEDTGDEISILIKNFNRMSSRLGKSFDSQKEFVENASHELKTPLAVIQANIDSVLEDDTASKEELQSVLKESKKNINFMNRLTEDLLLLSILELGVEKKDVVLKSVLESAVAQLQSLIREKGVDVQVGWEKKSNKVKVFGNATVLERSFMNLIENALHYSGCKSIGVVFRREGNFIVVSIKDDGKGMSKEDQKKIFERFYRIDKSRSRKYGGSGLGLAIVKRVIEDHEGDISLKSSNGKGSEFVIRLPI
jgi:signal transduction histidine kinase